MCTVMSQLHMLSILGSISFYWGTRIWDGAGNSGLYNLVELEMTSCCIGPWSKAELDARDPTGPDRIELWHCTRFVWYKAQDHSNQGCRSRPFWLESERFFWPGSGSYSYSYSYSTVNISFLRDPLRMTMTMAMSFISWLVCSLPPSRGTSLVRWEGVPALQLQIPLWAGEGPGCAELSGPGQIPVWTTCSHQQCWNHPEYGRNPQANLGWRGSATLAW